MDFLDSYSYGYDQVTVDPLRFVNYSDSDFKLHQNSMRDPVTKTIQAWEVQNSRKNDNPYADRGWEQRKLMNYVRGNLENIARPYDNAPCKDQVADRILVQNDDTSDLERELAHMRHNRVVEAKTPRSEYCPDCRMTHKCPSHSPSPGEQVREALTGDNILLILVVVLAAFCLIQYINTQNMNETLLGMIRNQHRPPVWLRADDKPQGAQAHLSPYVV